MAQQRSDLHSSGAAAATDFIEMHGWELPAVFTDVASEYRSAISEAAVHDASYMGRLKAAGTDALDLLNRLSTNEVVDPLSCSIRLCAKDNSSHTHSLTI